MHPHCSSVEKSAEFNKFGLSAGPRLDSGRKPVNSNQYGFGHIDPQARVLNYCFQWWKPIKSLGQNTHQDSVKKNGLQCIFASTQSASCLIILWCSGFQVSHSVYQFIGNDNALNSNTQWLQRHNLYQTGVKKVSNNKPFVKWSLLPSEVQIAQGQFYSKTR